MGNYKIIYDRKNCSGVAACNIVAETFWKMAEDGRADLVGATQIGDDIWELEIDEKNIPINLEAARYCPMLVIKIIDPQGKEVSFQRI